MIDDNLKSRNKKEEADISKQFKGLPIGELIGGPLSATADAQKNMAEYMFKVLIDKKNKVRENIKSNNE